MEQNRTEQKEGLSFTGTELNNQIEKINQQNFEKACLYIETNGKSITLNGPKLNRTRLEFIDSKNYKHRMLRVKGELEDKKINKIIVTLLKNNNIVGSGEYEINIKGPMAPKIPSLHTNQKNAQQEANQFFQEYESIITNGYSEFLTKIDSEIK